jgi:threonine dehydrogenase-like Zn-dependent dehydrogenase
MAQQGAIVTEIPGINRTTMSAAVIAAPQQLEIRQVNLADPAAGEVRVRLEGCGVCASNIPPWEGRPWFAYPMPPGSLGHEAWGHIDAVGREVKAVRVGDRVSTLSTQAYAEYATCKAEDVIPLPGSLDRQPFPGEPLACAMNVFERADIRPGQRVAIVGIGFLGALLTRLASSAGAEVIAISRRSFALDVAQTLGAVETVLMAREDCLDRVHHLTGGGLCERVIEAAGHQEALDLSGELVCERGKLVVAGYHQDGTRRINMQLWNWRGIDVINAHERDPQRYRDGVRRAINAVASGLLDPHPLYTHRFELGELGQAFEMVRRRPEGFLKALILL